MKSRRTPFVLFLITFVILTKPALAETRKRPPLPDPKVGVIIAKPETVTITKNLPARLEPSREAVIQARVNGIIEKRLFDEGSNIKAGQVLYKIDDDVYQANVQVAKAQLAQAEATRKLAQSTVNRFAPLVKEKAISRQQYEEAIAKVDVAKANIQAAKAQIKQAEISRNYTKITAPIGGYIGRSLVTEGALVSAASGTPMATIQQLDPMYVNISQSAGDFLRLKQAVQSGKSGIGGNTIKITLDDGTVYPHPGKLLFADQTVNPATGEILVRAAVRNPQRDLLPGLYVRVEVPQQQYQNIFLIPQQAVTRGANKDTVNILARDGSYSPRDIHIIQGYGNNWIVDQGLKPGEIVMVDQVSLFRQDAKRVQPVLLGKDGKPLPDEIQPQLIDPPKKPEVKEAIPTPPASEEKPKSEPAAAPKEN